MFKKLLTAAWMVLMLACCQFAAAATTVTVSATPSNPTAPANVTLAVTANSDTGPVMATQVEYFSGTTSLGIALQAPFTLAINDLAAGTYQITAKVTTTDPNNPMVQSPPLALSVGTPPGAATAYFIHTDQLNTPRLITNGTGAPVWQWDSDPFGKEPANEQPAGQPAFTSNLRFPGQQFDRESNLHYNYFRDYDPAVGRYIQSDPIGLNGGINTFGYVHGDPLIFSDPNGLCVGPLFPACVIAAENTPTILTVTSVVAGVATGADVPGPIGATSAGARTIAQQMGRIVRYPNWGAAKNALGNRPNQAIHHIVEQCQAYSHRSSFTAKEINSTNNLIRLDNSIHDKISAYYSSKLPGTNMVVRDWLNGKSFEVQYKFGIDVIERALKGTL